LEQQLTFLQRIHHLMNPEHRDLHDQTLEILNNKLHRVASILHKVESASSDPQNDGAFAKRGSTITKLRYLFMKQSLEHAIEEFETWQRTADTSWFLIMKMANSQIDEALMRGGPQTPNIATTVPSTMTIRQSLRVTSTISQTNQSLNLPFQQIRAMTITAIPRSDAQLAVRNNSAGQSTSFILNVVNCDHAGEYQAMKRNVRDLARRLQHDDPKTFGLLTCKGFITEPKELGYVFTFVFRTPPYCSSPCSLRDRLLTRPESPTFRLAVAKQLAKCVAHVHNFGFVHKNIRPESILVFEQLNGYSPISNVFLVGFENFRRDQGQTQRQGCESLERNLYQHHSRQGVNPQLDYTMKHDIYSLGLCLLEIGLWESFVSYRTEGSRSLASVLTLQSEGGMKKAPQDCDVFRTNSFLSIARSKLRLTMGDKYATIIETCLSCFDEGTSELQEEESEDNDGILIATRFIKMVSIEATEW
jgi:hypothetical protein